MSDERDTIIEFPCDFPIKAMGLAVHDLEMVVLNIINTHAPETPKDAFKSRHSSNGKYISVTVTINAQSQSQLDAIYYALTDHEHVMMSF